MHRSRSSRSRCANPNPNPAERPLRPANPNPNPKPMLTLTLTLTPNPDPNQAQQALQAQRPALSTDKEGDNQRTLSTIERLAALEVCLSTTRCVMPLLTYYYSKCISLSDSDSDMHSHLAIVICTVHSTCSDMHSHCFMLLLTTTLSATHYRRTSICLLTCS